MHTVLLIAQIVSAILLVLAILIQERGSGMGEAIGGTGGSGFETTKRGAERVIARATVVILGTFLAISLIINFV